MKPILPTLTLLALCPVTAMAAEQSPARGVLSTVPAKAWQYGFLTGNGRMGTIVYGDPSRETIVFNHERLYLPQRAEHRLVPLAKYLPVVRRVIGEKGQPTGLNVTRRALAKEGFRPFHSDPYHLAFTLNLDMAAVGEVRDYSRTTDFQTGEVAVRWRDDRGRFERSLFVSRPDNVVVLRVTGSAPVNLTLKPQGIKHALLRSTLKTDENWISYRNSYVHTTGGYDSAVRVVTRGGKTHKDGDTIRVEGAQEVLLIGRVEIREEKPADAKQDALNTLKASLMGLPASYDALLKPHALAHGAIFNRVTLDLGGGAERGWSSERLLARAAERKYRQVPPALIEKLYDASRFYFICSAGDTPPNLQGIWNGVFTAPWQGSYTLDTNLQMAMDSALSGNMMEGMEGYFKTIESWVPDWRRNAEVVFGARGLCAPIVSSPNSGLHLHHNHGRWTWWTESAGWLLSYFYDYYRFTGDREFLKTRAVPLMKELALFYEDHLKLRDANGRLLYRPSTSPESIHYHVSDNSTFSVAIAKELLTNLIQSCQTLGIEKENITKWRKMLSDMPPYEIGPDGCLAEWADGKFRHQYQHRHYSPFYPVFRSFEFSETQTPELWSAAKKALEKKTQHWLHNPKPANSWWGIPFGRAFHGQCAARFGQGAGVEEVLNTMTDRVYPSMFMSLRPLHEARKMGGKVYKSGMFSFDGIGAYPDIIHRALATSLDGTLDLLAAVPPGWRTGSISGILARRQLTVHRLAWNQDAGSIELELSSGCAQSIDIRVPGPLQSLDTVSGAVRVEKGGAPNGRKLTLPAKQRVALKIRYQSQSKPRK